MTVEVQCTLVLQSGEDSLQPLTQPTASAYPNRVISVVPPELAPLVSKTNESHYINSQNLSDYQTLASGVVAELGTDWSLDNTPYTSGHVENNGAWSIGSGYTFRFKKNSSYYEDDLPAVDQDCICRYILRIQPV